MIQVSLLIKFSCGQDIRPVRFSILFLTHFAPLKITVSFPSESSPREKREVCALLNDGIFLYPNFTSIPLHLHKWQPAYALHNASAPRPLVFSK